MLIYKYIIINILFTKSFPILTGTDDFSSPWDKTVEIDSESSQLDQNYHPRDASVPII